MWGACHLPARSPPEQSYSAPPAYMSMGQMESMMPPPPQDGSKAPGYRSASQRMVNSPIGTPPAGWLDVGLTGSKRFLMICLSWRAQR